MTRGPRWPLHPQPQPEESLSSWVFRLAQQYAMPWQEFCHGALGTEALTEDLLDRQPPVALVHALAVRTGVPPERIWTMPLTGYVPWLIDTLDTDDATCLSTYATQYQTLLRRQTPWMSKGLSNRATGRYCLPWLREPSPSDHTLCLACLRTDPIPHLRLFWRLGLLGSCPLHGCLLTPVSRPALGLIDAIETPLEAAEPDLLSVDALSWQAVTHGRVQCPCGAAMGAAVSGRCVRSLIEELFCRRSAAGADADTRAAIWEEVGCQPYAGLMLSKPFERLTLQQRRHTLRAVGRLLGDLPASLQRRMPRMAWGSLAPQRLPYALSQMCRRSQAAWDDDRSTGTALPPPTPPSLGSGQAQTCSLREAVTALEALVHSDAGAEQLICFITASSRRQTPQELWQLIHEIRASKPATEHQKNEGFLRQRPSLTTNSDCIAGFGLLTGSRVRDIRSPSWRPSRAENGYGAKLPENPTNMALSGQSGV